MCATLCLDCIHRCRTLSVVEVNFLLKMVPSFSHLESFYLGLSGPFDPDLPSQEASLSLDSSALQHLTALHLDSVWPYVLEVPPGCAVHATFQAAPGQRFPGIWASTLNATARTRQSLTSALFVENRHREWQYTASLLWPIVLATNINLFRINARLLCLNMKDLQGALTGYPMFHGSCTELFQAERVFISAIQCELWVSAYATWKHVSLRVSRDLLLSFEDMPAFVRQNESLSISCGEFVGPCRSQLCDAMAAAGKAFHLEDSHTRHRIQDLSGGQASQQNSVNRPQGSAQQGKQADAMHMRCCCHACEACLHRDGAADFPQEAMQDVAARSAH